jgi:hypothetical protein
VRIYTNGELFIDDSLFKLLNDLSKEYHISVDEVKERLERHSKKYVANLNKHEIKPLRIREVAP